MPLTEEQLEQIREEYELASTAYDDGEYEALYQTMQYLGKFYDHIKALQEENEQLGKASLEIANTKETLREAAEVISNHVGQGGYKEHVVDLMAELAKAILDLENKDG